MKTPETAPDTTVTGPPVPSGLASPLRSSAAATVTSTLAVIATLWWGNDS